MRAGNWTLRSRKAGRSTRSFFSEPIKDSHVGRYREVLSNDEIAQVERECEPLLALLHEAPTVFTTEPPEAAVTRESLSRLKVNEVLA